MSDPVSLPAGWSGVAGLRLRLASPLDVLAWSSGEVTRPQTVDSRSGRPVPGGLFCEQIFGPLLEWRCRCGRVTGEGKRQALCPGCGSAVRQRRGRRRQMGHVELAAPVVHVWFLKARPSPLAALLGMRPSDVEKMVYARSWVVTRRGQADVRVGELLSAGEAATLAERFAPEFRAHTGGRAIQILLGRLRLSALADRLRLRIQAGNYHPSLLRRLEVVEALRAGGVAPEWMVLERLPVIAPALRPMVRLGSGRFATSELNQLYRRVIRCNARLREYQERQVPRLIRLDAACQLQQAVDALLDNRRAGRPVLNARNQPLRSLSDGLGGKHGRFRGNLLGKRVDYSARAVIIGGPELLLEQCGLPRTIALRLYEPFLVARLRQAGVARTVRGAREVLRDLAQPERLARRVRGVVRELARQRGLEHARAVQSSRGALGPPEDAARALENAEAILRERDTPRARFRTRQILGELGERQAAASAVLAEQGPQAARRLVRSWFEERQDRLWGLVEEVVRGHPVLLNRAPTLHRMSIQAFTPVLVEGNALRLHPQVCKAFNADFDGDQMAVHLPLSVEARTEAVVLMTPATNLRKPTNGQPIVSPSQDMVVGCYYLTATVSPSAVAPGPARQGSDPASSVERGDRPMAPPPVQFRPPDTRKGEGKAFSSVEEVILAHSLGHLGTHARIRVRLVKPGRNQMGRLVVTEAGDEPSLSVLPGALLETTVGRVLFDAVVPAELPFYNVPLTAGRLARLVADCERRLGSKATVELLDRIKELGFREATRSGLSFACDDLPSPREREGLLAETQRKVRHLGDCYERGDLDEQEFASRLQEFWLSAQNRLSASLLRDLQNDTRAGQPHLNPVFVMLDSRARGDVGQLRQLAGMRGLMASASGRLIERAITASFREGLPSWDFFLSAHGGRKGLTDRGVRTADAGYLTRKLVDAAQAMVVTEHDCGTLRTVIRRAGERGLAARVEGRVSGETVEREGQELVREGDLIGPGLARHLERLGVRELRVRAPLTCEARRGLCRLCYGVDLLTGRLVELGAAVGVLAAQSIGEPGTQLTLHTFRLGGVAGQDIVDDLDAVTRLLEARPFTVERAERPETVDPHVLLLEEGKEVVQERLVASVAAIYARHGLEINERHFEVLVARMLAWVEVVEPADSGLLPGQLIEGRLLGSGRPGLRLRPRLLGISKVAGLAEGFLAAASFEKAVQVLTGAALAGRCDRLVGLKENVMLGRRIPAGTGLPGWERCRVVIGRRPGEGA